MHGIVFVPGISGSELLYKGATAAIWPPKLTDWPRYRELPELLDPKDVSVRNVIDAVLDVIPVYGETENDLKAIAGTLNGAGNAAYLPAPYDWRIDLLTAVDDLASKVEALAATVDEIIIVSHSMGGLLTRLLLEWKYAAAPLPAWFAKVKRALFACTPHLGAPTALARILGLETTEYVIQGDQMKEFAGDPHFPAVYELLPAASRGILFDTTSNTYIRYDDSVVVTAFGLSQQNLAALTKYSAALNPANKPATVEYTFVHGTNQSTDESVSVASLTLNGAAPQQDDLGDGTVPSWSIVEAAALFSPPIKTYDFPGSHLQVLTTDAFRQFLYTYFGVPGPAPLVAQGPGVVVSLNKRTYKPGETMHVLLVPDEEASSISGALTLSRIVPGTTQPAPLGTRQEVQLKGGPVRSLPNKLVAPTTPGVYRLDFGGEGASHRTNDKVAGWFVVSPR
jgi:pimeloyl-ACP methyl ester carboxylesterase